jgi:membrane associated rhomboid family serine protease
MQPFTRRWAAGRPTATATLIAISVGAFASQMLVEFVLTEHGDRGLLWQWLALDGASIQAGQYWKFLSQIFLHDGPFHLLANMLLLYFAGREVEPILGARHFVGIFAIANVLGALVQWLVMPAFPFVGVSAGVAAVLVAFTAILPELEVTVNVLFVLPLRLRAKHLGIAICAVSATGWYMQTTPSVGPAAILVGSIFGWLYAKQLGFGNPLAIQRYIFNRRQHAARIDRMSPAQFISAEIDPILDKIAREGMHSLTRAERKILAKGQEKIARKTARTR